MTNLTLPDRTLAYQQRRSSPANEGKPGLIFLGGFASDMTGTKASFLDERCEKASLAYLRFDYRGHGASSGTFTEGCIGDWADDALQILDKLAEGPQILIGSSMGGWIGLLLARARPERFAGFVGIAAAPDFTEDLIRPALSAKQMEELVRDGQTFETEADPDAPEDHRIPITQKLMEDGMNNLVLRAPIELDAPVRLLQGMRDPEVPWQTALKIAETVTSEDVRVTLVKDGEHRFSRTQDLEMMWDVIKAIANAT